MIAVRGIYDNYNSYGILTTEVVKGLIQEGIDVCCVPATPVDYRDGNWQRVKHFSLSGRWAPATSKYPKELVILPPVTACNYADRMSENRIHMTTFESPRLDREWVNFENSCKAVFLPCEANVISFNASGVKVPIFKVPYGYDESFIRPVPMNMKGPCIFGIGGRIHRVTDSRKGAERAISIFKKAFPDEQDVRLIIKTLSCDPPLTKTTDNRVFLERSYIEASKMLDWYSQLTCYLSLSCSEGWGLMQFESQVVGRPVITTNYLGTKEYFIPEAGYEVGGEFTKARVYPADFEPGVWLRPDEDSVIMAMRSVYTDREEALRKGLLASEYCKDMTWLSAIKNLIKALEKMKFL